MATRPEPPPAVPTDWPEAPPTSAYARKATGMVREVPLIDMFAFNAAGVGGIAFALLVGLYFAFVAFPGGNLVLALVIALPLVGFVWVTFSLVGAVFPRVGGDYVFGSRVIHPVVGLASNLGVFVSTILALGAWVALMTTTIAAAPVLSVVGTTTGRKWWLDAASTIQQHKWQIVIAVIVAVVLTALSAIRTRLITRLSTISLAVSYAGFFIAFLVLLFTSRGHFVNTLNDFSDPITKQHDTYNATIAAGAKAGVHYPDKDGYSVRSTIGTLFPAMSVMLYVWWGVYMSGEMKGAGQRRRQLTAILGAGYLQAVLIVLATAVFIKTIGYDFFASANAGNYAVTPSPFYNFFASIVVGNDVVAVLLGLAFLGTILPGMYINFAMCQRALFAYAFDGLLPRRVASVSERTHTPVVAIVLVGIGSIVCAVYAVYGSNFLQILTVTAALLFLPMFVTGLSGVLLPKRHPELYNGSPADWRWHGIPALKVASWGCMAVSLLFISLLAKFHAELGIKNVLVVPLLVPASFAVAWIWYEIARRVQRARGVDLDLVYRTIPPE
jgi:basic amino acid/polyamine antiporter, APA family